MNLFRLSVRMLKRDWRAGELRVLVFALIIAVGGMTTVGFFSDRVQLALARQGNQLLGADLIIASDRILPSHYQDEAKRLGLSVSSSLKFPSMASSGDSSLLTEIKAVTQGYPSEGSYASQRSLEGGWQACKVVLPNRFQSGVRSGSMIS